jgi:hypothetical protein
LDWALSLPTRRGAFDRTPCQTTTHRAAAPHALPSTPAQVTSFALSITTLVATGNTALAGVAVEAFAAALAGSEECSAIIAIIIQVYTQIVVATALRTTQVFVVG